MDTVQRPNGELTRLLSLENSNPEGVIKPRKVCPVRNVLSVDYLGWLSLMLTLEESTVANSGSTKVWVMDPSLFDV
jgi:hypothetical protein